MSLYPIANESDKVRGHFIVTLFDNQGI